MQFRTHLAFSLLVALVIVNLEILKSSITFIVIVLFFSLLPDIDTPESFLGRMTRPFSNLIRAFVGHRTFFHSVWAPAAIFILIAPFSIIFALAASLGYLSHLLIDMMNEKGLRPLWPLNFHISGPFATGGFFELILFFVLIGIDSLLIIKFL